MTSLNKIQAQLPAPRLIDALAESEVRIEVGEKGAL